MIKDTIDSFELSDELLLRCTNEFNSLAYLRDGLEYLYSHISECESIIRRRSNPEVQVISWGNDERLARLPMGIVSSKFHWYAVSACNYVKLIGWLHRQEDPAAPDPSHYVKSVIPEVQAWRDKVAAHFARTSPPKDKRDNPAEAIASVFPVVTLMDEHFFAGMHQIAYGIARTESTSAAIKPWSLTAVHERLTARYVFEAPHESEQ